MVNNKNIICFAPNDWWAQNPSCTTHIMTEFAVSNRILYVNPFSSDLFGLKSKKGSKVKKGMGVRIKRKLNSIFNGVKKINDNLYIFSPFFLPLQGKKGFDLFNNIFIRLQLVLVLRHLGFENPILWIENMRAAATLNWLKSELIVYHVSDLFAKDRYSSNQKILENRELYISNKSDLTICVSRELYEMKTKHWSNVVYQPHGVDFDVFRKAVEYPVILEELINVPHPIAGYFGTMTANNDIEMMEFCAERLPNISFVFAGQITTGDYRKLQEFDNVFILGRIAYERIPHLCASFDVCMLQWKVSEWIRACNPLKMLEYMASGKPIVSVEIKEAIKYNDIISIAQNREEFCKAIMWEIENDNDKRKLRRIEIASRYSWRSNVNNISNMMEEALKQKGVLS